MRVGNVLGMLLTLTTIAAAQLQPPAFEVATVKRSRADDSKSISSVLLFLPGGGFRRTNVTLKSLIQTAYGIQDSQIFGATEWMESELYDVEAKSADGANPGRADVLLMVQALLADRFKLKLHHEVREATRYALRPARTGVKMKLAPDSTGGARGTNGRITGKRTMSQLADLLSAVLQRPVVDETGLSGLYEFTLEWSPELRQTGLETQPPVNPTAPSIFTALQEQLGLQLNSTKAPVEVLVVDHAERPSEN